MGRLEYSIIFNVKELQDWKILIFKDILIDRVAPTDGKYMDVNRHFNQESCTILNRWNYMGKSPMLDLPQCFTADCSQQCRTLWWQL